MIKLVGKLDKVLEGIRNCKRNSTCTELMCRKYYFEPNSQTIVQWHEKGLYKAGIDTRAMFVCESPGGLACKNAEPDDIEIVRCWDITEKDNPFFDVRLEYGLENCYITNLVKCGVKKANRHKPIEINNCSEFLIEEIGIIKPKVIVAVGENVEQILRQDDYMKLFSKQGCQLFPVTHYSARNNPKDNRWPHEFKMLSDLIDAKVAQKTDTC